MSVAKPARNLAKRLYSSNERKLPKYSTRFIASIKLITSACRVSVLAGSWPEEEPAKTARAKGCPAPWRKQHGMRNLRHTDSAMEWPAHQLLRQQCDPDVESCSDSEAESSSIGGVVHLRKCHSESSGYSNSSGNLKKLAAEDLDPLTGHKQQQQQPQLHKVHRSSHAQRAHSWKRRCMSYSRLDGWWVLCAEFLGTIILIALCVVAANQARSMSEEVDTVALAALARSNSRAICVNASTDNVQGRIIQGVNLQLVPSSFRDAGGRHWKRAGLEVGLRAPTGLWNFPVNSPEIPMDSVFTQTMLASMYKCGIIRGAYHSQDLPSYISRGCRQCRIELGASLNTSSPVASNWTAADDINCARSHPALESKVVQYRLARVLNTTLMNPEQFSQLLTPSLPAHSDPTGLLWLNKTSNLLMFSQDEFLPGLDAIPHAVEIGYDSNRDYFVTPGTGSPTFQGMETSLYMGEELWHTAVYHSHHRHLDPRAVPAGTLRVDVFHTPPPSFMEVSKPAKGQHVSSVWLELNQQSAKTAHCMAESASLAVDLLQQARYSLRQPNGTVLQGVRPREHNISFEQLWLRLDANLDAARPYACAEGVDVTSADATAYLTRLDAYKSTAKSQYRTTIFLSMHHQTAEDIYAVYTGALGAVFGSMALLVATLFVYVIAAARHVFGSGSDHHGHRHSYAGAV